jgi:hypothetical protein
MAQPSTSCTCGHVCISNVRCTPLTHADLDSLDHGYAAHTHRIQLRLVRGQEQRDGARGLQRADELVAVVDTGIVRNQGTVAPGVRPHVPALRHARSATSASMMRQM